MIATTMDEYVIARATLTSLSFDQRSGRRTRPSMTDQPQLSAILHRHAGLMRRGSLSNSSLPVRLYNQGWTLA